MFNYSVKWIQYDDDCWTCYFYYGGYEVDDVQYSNWDSMQEDVLAWESKNSY